MTKQINPMEVMDEVTKKKIEVAASNYANLPPYDRNQGIYEYTIFEKRRSFEAGAQFGYALASEEIARLKEKLDLAIEAITHAVNEDKSLTMEQNYIGNRGMLAMCLKEIKDKT